MFGPRLNTVFTSRWKALWWAAGVCLTAYCTVPFADQADKAKQAAAPPAHINPWAKGYKADQPPPPPQEDAIQRLQEAVREAEQGSAPAEQHVNPWAKKPEQQQKPQD